MGLITAAINSASGVIADQWKDFFTCDSIPADILVVKGYKKTAKGTSRGTDNVITNGSRILVADGQCMMIVDQGKIVDLCAVPGAYTFDFGTEASVFDGGKLGDNIKNIFEQMCERFSYGGAAPKDARIYYFNIKEIIGNKYGTPSPIPFRVVDQRAGIDMDISVKCFGEYSYKITNPMLFYTNVCGNVSYEYNRSEIDHQLRSELLTALQPAFARISDMGIRYSSLPGHTTELANALRAELSASWKDTRGIEIQAIGVNSVKADEEDEKTIKQMQKQAAYRDPSLAAASLVNATGEAMQTAAGNAAGAMTGFMGMNMASQASGINLQSLYGMSQAQTAQTPVSSAPVGSWTCSCGTTNTGNFCANCGSKKPAATGWTCSCGTVNTGNFCSNCGTKKPAADTWTCSCGTVNKGKFCANCGTKRPE